MTVIMIDTRVVMRVIAIDATLNADVHVNSLNNDGTQVYRNVRYKAIVNVCHKNRLYTHQHSIGNELYSFVFYSGLLQLSWFLYDLDQDMRERLFR